MIIFKEIKKQPFDYLLLLAVSLLTIILFLLFGNHGHSHFQRRVLYAFTAFYFIWSLVHHSRRRDLQLSIIVEYLLLALLALIIISGI